MARARNIKPGFYKNEDLAECSVWARFIFPGLWMLADRDGRLEDRPKRIKGELLPFDNQDIEPLLRELEARGFLVRYQKNGASFIQIHTFTTHQTPHYSEKPSVIPPPDSRSVLGNSLDDAPATPRTLQEHSWKSPPMKRGSQPPDSLNPDSLNPDSLNPDSLNPDSLNPGSTPNPDLDLKSPVIEKGGAGGGVAKPEPTARRATRLADDWFPDEDLVGWTRAAQPTWSDEHIAKTVDEFRDYWRAVPGQRGTKLDWPATWRNRVRALDAARPAWGKPQAKNGTAVAGVFVVEGAEIVVHVNRNGEFDQEHIGLAGMLGISTRGKYRPELQQKIIDKLHELQA